MNWIKLEWLYWRPYKWLIQCLERQGYPYPSAIRKRTKKQYEDNGIGYGGDGRYINFTFSIGKYY